MKRLMGLLMLAVMTVSALVGCGGGGGGGGVTGVQMGGSIQGIPLSLHRAVTTLAGTAAASGSTDGAGAAARFYLPSGITTDRTNFFVADSFNHTIRKVVIATGMVTTVAGTAGSDGSTDGTGAAARFIYPYDVTTDGANLFVAVSGDYTIRKVVIATGGGDDRGRDRGFRRFHRRHRRGGEVFPSFRHHDGWDEPLRGGYLQSHDPGNRLI